VPELLPKAKKYEVKMEHSLRPVSRASANPAAEKISKEIETINKNKITRQPLTDSHSVNASKRNSVESKRNSVDTTQRQSIDTTRTDTLSKRHSIGATSLRSDVSKPEHSRPLSMMQVRGGPQKAMAVTKSAGMDTPIANSFAMSHAEPQGGAEKTNAVVESTVIDTPIANRYSMSHLQVRGGPEKAKAVAESAGVESSVPKRNSMSHVHVRGGPQKATAVMESAKVEPPASKRNSISNVSIRGGPEKQKAVLESANHSRRGSAAAESNPDPLKMHPPEIRGGPQKQSAVLESAGVGRQRSTTSESVSGKSEFASVQTRGGPQKAMAVMESASHARNSSVSSRASNRYSVGDVESLMNSYEQTSNAAKRMSHPPLNNRRSFSDGSQPVADQDQSATPSPASTSNSGSLSRKPSGRKTAERLAWIRELEEGNKAGGNHGRDYMFNKLQGGVRDKLAKFENQQLTGGLARTNSNLSRRLSNSSDAYSIEQGSLKRLSRSTTIDDEFRKKLEGTVAEQQKKTIVPQEVLDLVALSDGDHEAALNELMQYWNQEELIKQINNAADHAAQTPESNNDNDAAQANGKPIEPISSGISKADFTPTTATGLKKQIVETPAPLPLSQTKSEKLPELRNVPITDTPKIPSWNPKPTLKSEPMRAANGATILFMPEGTSKWNPKPNPPPAPVQKEDTAPKAFPEAEVVKTETKPAGSKLSVVPGSLLLGSNAAGAKWNPKPSVKAEPIQKQEKANPEEVKPEAKDVLATQPEPVQKSEEVKDAPKSIPAAESKPIEKALQSNSTQKTEPVVEAAPVQEAEKAKPVAQESPAAILEPAQQTEVVKTAPREPPTPKSPSRTPAPLALSRSNGNASKSPYTSPTKSSFTAAALPQFAEA
jgi:hypothetical protein